MTVPDPTCCMLAALPEYPGLTETITYQFTGLLVVFMALGGIWALIELTGLFFRRLAARRPLPPLLPQPQPATAGAPSFAIHAVIAATVHCIYRGRARIVSIEPTDHDLAWAREGRRAIFSSHKIH